MSTSDFDRDDELQALLRSGDPAASLSPADPDALASLLEDIMSADLDVRPEADGTRATGTHGRNRLTWLVAAAAAAVIAGAGGFAISGLSGDDPGPQASDHRTTPDTSGDDQLALTDETTQLTASAPSGRCAVPSAEIISQYPMAFQGTVAAVEGNTVTLHTSEVYTGEVGETVQVTANPAGFAAMLRSVDFQVGQSYLVAAADGQLSMCGFSGAATGELRSLYDKAFLP